MKDKGPLATVGFEENVDPSFRFCGVWCKVQSLIERTLREEEHCGGGSCREGEGVKGILCRKVGAGRVWKPLIGSPVNTGEVEAARTGEDVVRHFVILVQDYYSLPDIVSAPLIVLW